MPRKKKATAKTDPVLESPTSPVQAITPRSGPLTWVCSSYDTYASIAADFLPPKLTRHQYAVYLADKNQNKVIRKGTVIEL
jgi:hypothetical protein